MMRFLLSLFVLVALVSCKDPKTSLGERIDGLESSMKSSVELDTVVANEAIAAYFEYAEKYPRDSVSPYYMSRAADVMKELPGKGLEAIEVYRKFGDAYPDHSLAGRSAFMVGFVYDTKYNNRDEAINAYKHFIYEFDEHPLKGDAVNLLNLLEDTTRTELELIKQWMKQSASSKQMNNNQ